MNHRIVLASRPQGLPRPENFRLEDSAVPTPDDGEVLIRHTWLGLAPAARLRMGEQASYREPMAIGEVVYGQAIGEVMASRDAALRAGDIVMSMSAGWQALSVAKASTLVKLDLELAPPGAWLGALGTSGMTAYVGLLDIGQARSGETVVVSAASGGVGSMVGQIAKIQGCRVVGIAGGRAKSRHLVEVLGFDAGVDHRHPEFKAQLKAALPGGVDVYFDNVGGAVRDGVWPLMNQNGRIVVCGLISEYNDSRQAGPGWFEILAKRLTLRGFILSDSLHRRNEFTREMTEWYRAGKIKQQDDISDGLDSTVGAFIRMLSGHNFGKTLVRL